MTKSAPRVFVSYSHESPQHKQQVLALSERLRRDGIDAHLDQYVKGTPVQGWSRWTIDELERADFVLLVCNQTYYRRFRGHDVPGVGQGVDWEAALITRALYERQSKSGTFVPILLSAEDIGFIPEPVRDSTHYLLTSDPAYQALCDFLLGQAGAQPGALGQPRRHPRSPQLPLSFGGSNPEPALSTEMAGLASVDHASTPRASVASRRALTIVAAALLLTSPFLVKHFAASRWRSPDPTPPKALSSGRFDGDAPVPAGPVQGAPAVPVQAPPAPASTSDLKPEPSVAAPVARPKPAPPKGHASAICPQRTVEEPREGQFVFSCVCHGELVKFRAAERSEEAAWARIAGAVSKGCSP